VVCFASVAETKIQAVEGLVTVFFKNGPQATLRPAIEIPPFRPPPPRGGAPPQPQPTTPNHP